MKISSLLVWIVLLCWVTAPVPGNTTVISCPFTLDAGVNPGDDLFGYVNNVWISEHPVPANKSSYLIYSALDEHTLNNLHTLFEQESTQNAAGEESLIGRFYASGMDTDTINSQGISPLAGELARIDAIQTPDDLGNISADLVAEGIPPFFIYYADQDPTNSTWVIPHVVQGGIGLPDRDYYFRNDTTSKEIRDAYREHVKTVFLLMNASEADADRYAGIVYGIEEEIAASHYTTVENRDPVNTTHILTWDDLKSRYPAIGWDQLATINGSGRSEQIDLHQLTAVNRINQMLTTVPLDDWKVFLKFRLVDSLSSFLSTPFDEENFNFYSHTLDGVQIPEPRWKRVLFTVNTGLSDEVGKRYVDAYFNASAREEARTISHAIKSVLHERIANLTWMEEATKNAALEKLDATVEKIGYPDTWLDYSGLNLTDSYVSNVLEINRYNTIHGPVGLEKIGKPVDRGMWVMSPQTVNAYYNPTLNEMVFPAAILQPPFFYPGGDDSINYGGIGATIGHELIHGFEDKGRLYDKDGNLRDWWTANDSARFANQTSILIDQYNQFEVVPGVYGNGNQTLGENIADFGGLILAYHAWKEHGRDVTNLPDSANITPAQRFFISYASSWAGSARDEYLRSEAYTDPHPWAKFRANGPSSNMPEFYESFPAIGPDNALYRPPEERPVIW
ncbi:MAG: M13 family metallopeptidase [Methanospirillum sp.]|uniref:M13 family metallopeptidase n=1 Tax=Methanospirillum sp. TaxID=45200 RepID=UPI002368FD40|nr:M13 family metallopeptidase [Methanospirillum sp.]MDD1729079.1 M13 family metallopeptidase [Methanospirillum sp.]